MPDDDAARTVPGEAPASEAPTRSTPTRSAPTGAVSTSSAPTGGVLACGLATLDVVQTVDHVPASDEKLVATDLRVAAGGPAANAAVTAALLGVPARLVTRIGGGATGQVVLADLRGAGVDVVDLAATGATPPVSTVLVTAATGERAVVSMNGTGAPPDPEAWDGVAPGVWDGVVVVLLDGHHLDLAVACARAARARGVPVVLDGGSWKPGLEDLLPLVDVAVLSADFAMPGVGPAGVGPAGVGPAGVGPAGVGGGDDLLAAVRTSGPGVAAQSHGPGPVRVLTDAGLTSVQVPDVAVADTLGAGDVLHGALAAWIAARAGFSESGADDVVTGLAWAAAVASASCTAPGARAWADDRARLASLHRDLGIR